MSYETFRLTDEGGQAILDLYWGEVSPIIELFVDNAPVDDADQGQARELAEGGGYTDKSLGAFAVSLDPDGVPQCEWEDVVWTFDGPLTNTTNKSIKGYMVLVDNVVIFEEVFATPFTPQNEGDKWTVSPVFKLGNGIPL